MLCLYLQLLEPLQQRLKYLLQRYPIKTFSKEPGVKTELLSIVECLCGVGLVSKASLVHNFIVFLQPVLVTLVEVFDAFSNCQEVMVIILELFSIIAENYITFLNEVPAIMNIPYIYNCIVIIYHFVAVGEKGGIFSPLAITCPLS